MALSGDYKNAAVFSNFVVGEMLVVVHDEGQVLGYRAFAMLDTTQPLARYFQGGPDRCAGENCWLRQLRCSRLLALPLQGTAAVHVRRPPVDSQSHQ